MKDVKMAEKVESLREQMRYAKFAMDEADEMVNRKLDEIVIRLKQAAERIEQAKGYRVELRSDYVKEEIRGLIQLLTNGTVEQWVHDYCTKLEFIRGLQAAIAVLVPAEDEVGEQ